MKSFRCDKNINGLKDSGIISKCLNRKIAIKGFIGSGSFGKIYKAEYILDNKKISVAVKKIEENTRGMSAKRIKHLINDTISEVDYNYYVSKYDIAPKVYDSFFVLSKNSLLCYIIMELYTCSVEKLYYQKIPLADLIKIHNNMIDLMKKQVYESRLYCTDIKPENFVVKKLSGNNYKVRAIDYGTDWCSLEVMPKSFKTREYFYTIILIQLCLKIYIHIKNENSFILSPFYKDSVIIKITENFKNFKTLKNVLYNVMLDEEGEQIKYYFVEIIEDVVDLKISNDIDIVNTIIFIYEQIYRNMKVKV